MFKVQLFVYLTTLTNMQPFVFAFTVIHATLCIDDSSEIQFFFHFCQIEIRNVSIHGINISEGPEYFSCTFDFNRTCCSIFFFFSLRKWSFTWTWLICMHSSGTKTKVSLLRYICYLHAKFNRTSRIDGGELNVKLCCAKSRCDRAAGLRKNNTKMSLFHRVNLRSRM